LFRGKGRGEGHLSAETRKQNGNEGDKGQRVVDKAHNRTFWCKRLKIENWKKDTAWGKRERLETNEKDIQYMQEK